MIVCQNAHHHHCQNNQDQTPTIDPQPVKDVPVNQPREFDEKLVGDTRVRKMEGEVQGEKKFTCENDQENFLQKIFFVMGQDYDNHGPQNRPDDEKREDEFVDKR